MIKSRYKNQRGVATLPTVLALSFLIMAVGISILAITYNENIVALDQKQALQALRYAESGVKDALVKMDRNRDYNCVTTDCYTIDMVTSGCANGTGCSKVTVSAGTGGAGDPKIITAKGIVENITKKIQVGVTYDASLNGQITSYTWLEQTN
jgi:hypothetical protein